MPCWSGSLKVVVYVVEFVLLEYGSRVRRWKGESMENSSWKSSSAVGEKGIYLSQEYSDTSIE